MNSFIFDCQNCATPCDGQSKRSYIFMNDVEYSEHHENQIIEMINSVPGFYAKKCDIPGYPDIEVNHAGTQKTFFVEIKAQRRTFMSVKKILPDGGLEPSETLALNLSDLLRYFQIREETGLNVFILWCVENRPCIVPENETCYFYQHADILRTIYEEIGNKRRFRRESGYGDVVNGKHKGVVVNYHFSLNELEPLDIAVLLERGIL